MMAPELPADFVARPKEFDALKARLLDPEGDSVAGITAALRGAGGYGKTTLAKALARDPDIQDAYFDGILWAELGEKPERLVAILSDLITLLSGERPQLETINAAAAKLGEALGDRRILMVVDDVWRGARPATVPAGRPALRPPRHHPDRQRPARRRPSARRSTRCRRARRCPCCPADCREDQVAREARQRSPDSPHGWANGRSCSRSSTASCATRSRAASRCRRDRRAPTSGSTPRASSPSTRRPIAFDPHDRANAKAVARTIGVSLDLLSEPERERFGELGVFPEDADIPVGVVARLWAADGRPCGFRDRRPSGSAFRSLAAART